MHRNNRHIVQQVHWSAKFSITQRSFPGSLALLKQITQRNCVQPHMGKIKAHKNIPFYYMGSKQDDTK
uniref:Uncharacterized protein n=1 Tax=Anguilla anguilla TaxID=7936 RepID=A0A0E9XXJ1_ANGAN